MAEFGFHRTLAEMRHLRMVTLLIQTGSSVDSRDSDGRTPLHLAAERGEYRVAEFLISNKCDPDVIDDRFLTPVLLAANGGHKDIVDLLLRHGASGSCAKQKFCSLLHYASRNGWTDIAHSLVLEGEDPNAATMLGDTPLITAASWGQEEVADLLITLFGADVNLRNAQKKTALHCAAYEGCAGVVQVLLKVNGLDLNPQDEDGGTPLHEACKGEHAEVVKQLLEAGADPNIKNVLGKTALGVGFNRGGLRALITFEEIRLFVQHGAFLEDCDYVHISQIPALKKSVLKDVQLCTQIIVNKFHGHSLHALKSISYFASKLPNIDKFKLNARQIEEVENLVKFEIEGNTFCNVVKLRPMALSALCVLSLITCQSGTKQSASPDSEDCPSPFKKLRT